MAQQGRRVLLLGVLALTLGFPASRQLAGIKRFIHVSTDEVKGENEARTTHSLTLTHPLAHSRG
jgi:dTDP-D-glucose 4,6-dehydratase